MKKPPRKQPSQALEAAKTNARRRREEQRALLEQGEHMPPQRNDLLPDVRYDTWPIERVFPSPYRLHRPSKVDDNWLEMSLRENGLTQPLPVMPDGTLIDGNRRLEIARRMGMRFVRVAIITHLPKSKVKKLRITLNNARAPQDREGLRALAMELIDEGEDLTTAGFLEAEIDTLLLDEEFATGGPEERLPNLREETVSGLGNLWGLGNNLLLQADCRDLHAYDRLMDGEFARAVLTDQPFNAVIAGLVRRHREFLMASGEMTSREFHQFILDWMRAALFHLMDGGVLATFSDWRGIETTLAAGRELDLTLLNFIVWVKENGGQGSLYRSRHELFPLFKKGKEAHVNNVQLGANGRWRSNVWEYPGGSSLGSDSRQNLKNHPTPKSRQLVEDAILDLTNRGDIVIDPFLGSGTTLVAAEAMGRRCHAIEIDSQYCDVSIRRWQAMTGEPAILLETGETFEQVAERRSRGRVERAPTAILLPPPRKPGGRS